MYITPVINHIPLVSGNANIDNNCFMENREQEILSEIKSMMASIRSQLEKLDAKMAELQQVVDPEGFEANSIDIEIDEADMIPAVETVEALEIPLVVEVPAEPMEEPVIETVPEPEAAVEEPVAPVEEPAEEPVDEPVEEPVQEPEDKPAEIPAADDDDLPFGDLPEEDDDDLPAIFAEPETVTVASKAAETAKPTINDKMAADQAWRKDMPGTPVRDIRSAISLNDRVIFINHLFDEDAQAFVDALGKINSMQTLDEVVEFIVSGYPQWDLNSELVYRFMMAVRRKVGR